MDFISKLNRPNRRDVLTGIGALALLGNGRLGKGQPARPNIVFIMADDLGYADLSVYGRREYATPNIDRLAVQGRRYLNAYANSSVCSATRTALITGQYQYRFPVGLEEPLIPLRDLGLEPDVPTLPGELCKAGYRTALIGKWHLGELPKYGPLQSGYDEFWGFRGGGIDYFSHDSGGREDLWDGDQRIEETGYLTNLLGQRATEFIEEAAANSRPFFLSLHFSAPHWPWEGPNDIAESERIGSRENPYSILHWDGGSLATYAEMVTALDNQVGEVLAALDRAGMSDNTIVIFTSDNGGERFSDTWPFSGKKTELLEGGLRIPSIVRWPGRIAPGETSSMSTMSMDWVPTLLAAAGVSPSPDLRFDGAVIFDGQGTEIAVDRQLFWRYRYRDQQAALDGRWKYLKINDNTFLFDIEADPLERANLKERYPDIYRDLKIAYDRWNSTMLAMDPSSYSHAFSPAEMADHMGSDPKIK